MEPTYIDSLYELAQQEQGNSRDRYVVARAVYEENRDGFTRFDILYFDDLRPYFTEEETGEAIYDSADQLLVFGYNLPSGMRIIIYAFYLQEAFNKVIDILGERGEEYDLDANLSKKVISQGDLGLFLPTVKDRLSNRDFAKKIIGDSQELTESYFPIAAETFSANGIEEDRLAYLIQDPYQSQQLFETSGNRTILFGNYENFADDYRENLIEQSYDIGGYAPRSDLPLEDEVPIFNRYAYNLLPPNSRI